MKARRDLFFLVLPLCFYGLAFAAIFLVPVPWLHEILMLSSQWPLLAAAFASAWLAWAWWRFRLTGNPHHHPWTGWAVAALFCSFTFFSVIHSARDWSAGASTLNILLLAIAGAMTSLAFWILTGHWKALGNRLAVSRVIKQVDAAKSISGDRRPLWGSRHALAILRVNAYRSRAEMAEILRLAPGAARGLLSSQPPEILARWHRAEAAFFAYAGCRWSAEDTVPNPRLLASDRLESARQALTLEAAAPPAWLTVLKMRLDTPPGLRDFQQAAQGSPYGSCLSELFGLLAGMPSCAQAPDPHLAALLAKVRGLPSERDRIRCGWAWIAVSASRQPPFLCLDYWMAMVRWRSGGDLSAMTWRRGPDPARALAGAHLERLYAELSGGGNWGANMLGRGRFLAEAMKK